MNKRETIIFIVPNYEGEFHIIEKRGYTGKGYRYSLKMFDSKNSEKANEVYYCDSFKTSKTSINSNKLIVEAIKHLNDMEIL